MIMDIPLGPVILVFIYFCESPYIESYSMRNRYSCLGLLE